MVESIWVISNEAKKKKSRPDPRIGLPGILKKTDEYARDEGVRFLWGLMHTERQRLESDVSHIDDQRGMGESRREILAKRIKEVSERMSSLEKRYPDVFGL